MNQQAKPVCHVENIPDGAAINVLTEGRAYYNYISAGCCVNDRSVCLLIFKKEKKGHICIPIRDIKEMEVVN